MNTLYLDLSSGISGDMFVAMLIDLGVDFAALERELAKLNLDGFHLHAARQQKSGIAGIKFDVHLAGEHDPGHSPAPHSHGHEHGHTHGHSHGHGHGEHDHDHGHGHEHGRSFAEIKTLITGSTLSEWVKEKSIAVFHRLAVAEGRVHGVSPDAVTFHEVGAIDSIVDIVGGCIGLELIGKPRVLASPVVEGSGWVQCAHGRFPVPTPATLAVLGQRGIALTQCNETNELVTPTGAAMLAEFAESFGPMRGLVASKLGFGLGTRENKTRPNLLRGILGESAGDASSHDWETDTVAVIETNLDDISSEVLGHLVERTLAEGALDVFHTPIQMKKSRPGVLLTILCSDESADKFCELLLRETSAFGVRRNLAERRKLRREFTQVKTPHGEVTVKLGRLDGRVLQAAPEFESCKQVAEKAGVPLKDVYAAAIAAYRSQ